MNKSEKLFDVKKIKDETSETAIKLSEIQDIVSFQRVGCAVKVVRCDRGVARPGHTRASTYFALPSPAQ